MARISKKQQAFEAVYDKFTFWGNMSYLHEQGMTLYSSVVSANREMNAAMKIYSIAYGLDRDELFMQMCQREVRERAQAA